MQGIGQYSKSKNFNWSGIWTHDLWIDTTDTTIWIGTALEYKSKRSWVQISLQSKFSGFDYSPIPGVILASD